MKKLTDEQFTYLRSEVKNFIDREFLKREEGDNKKGTRGTALVILYFFIHYLRFKSKEHE